MNAPVHSNAIDVSKITFQVGKAQENRNPSITVRYNGAPLQLRIPRLGFPFGLRENANDSGDKSYTLSAVLKGCDPYCKDKYSGDDEIGKLYNMLTDLDEHIIKSAVDNSVAWFKKKRTMETVRDTYNNIVRPSKENRNGEMVANGKYAPTFRIKVPVYDGRVSASFVDASRNDVYVTPDSLVSVLPKGIEANLVATLSIYVLAGGTFGVTLRLKAAQIFPVAQITAAMMFEDETNAAPSQTVANNTEPLDEEYGGGSLAEESLQKDETSVEEIKPLAGAGGPPPSSTPAVRKRRVVASASLS
jgi:hypothetical protein